VTNVLLMPTLQIRDPVFLLVRVKADDLLFQCLTISIVVFLITTQACYECIRCSYTGVRRVSTRR
jgi:hypothetical protein